MKSKQSGFTLVEIAIVLVIIGLLLGGVLKGQEMITSSKAKSLFSDKSAFQAAYNAYADRYRAIPGDDALASGRFSALACGAVACSNGNGNGAIANQTVGAQDPRLTATGGAAINAAAAGANEVYKFWQHLRAAQLIKTEGSGAGEIFIQPNNATNGWTGVHSVAPYTFQTPSTLYITQIAVPGNVAGAMDSANDDGFTNRGSIRAVDGAAAAAAGVAYGAANANVSMNLL
jgi:prepilin-type N-terminal cleavage/methylation domain-containing protein